MDGSNGWKYTQDDTGCVYVVHCWKYIYHICTKHNKTQWHHEGSVFGAWFWCVDVSISCPSPEAWASPRWVSKSDCFLTRQGGFFGDQAGLQCMYSMYMWTHWHPPVFGTLRFCILQLPARMMCFPLQILPASNHESTEFIYSDYHPFFFVIEHHQFKPSVKPNGF